MATRRPFPILPDIDVEVDAPPPRVTLPPLPGERAQTTSPSVTQAEPARPPRPMRPVQRQPKRSSFPTAILFGAPSLITASLAILLSRTGALLGGAFGGVASIVIVGALAAGCWIAWQTSSTIWRCSWLVALGVTTALLPLVTLQATLARLPHVGTAGDYTGAALLTTLGVVAVLIVIAGLVAGGCWADPHAAGPLFIPAGLLVPAVLSVPELPAESAVLVALAEACALGGAAIAVAWLLPKGLRPLVGPFALAIQFVLLWIKDLGPQVDPSSGTIVPVLYGTLIAVTVVLVVLVPLVAVWLRRLMSEVANEGGGAGVGAPVSTRGMGRRA